MKRKQVYTDLFEPNYVAGNLKLCAPKEIEIVR